MGPHPVRLPGWLFPLAVLLLTALPLLELAILIAIGRKVGLWPTLLLCAVTGFAGAWLARWQGTQVLVRARRALVEGRFPSEEIFTGAALLVGGTLLLTPGLVTDCLGLLLLLPFTRRALARALRRRWLLSQGIVEV